MDCQTIFFSYSRADASEFSLKLASELRNAGVDIWIDQLNIQGGETWDIAIEHALKASYCVLFIVSEKSVVSRNVLDEVYYALDEQKQVIPIIISHCELPFRIRRLQQIDFTKNYDSAHNRLLHTLSNKKITGANEDAQSMQTQAENKKLRYQLLAGGVLFLCILYLAHFFYTPSARRPDGKYKNNDLSKVQHKNTTDMLQKPGLDRNDSASILLAKYYLDNDQFERGSKLLCGIFEKENTCPGRADSCYYANAMKNYQKQNFMYAFAWFSKAASENNAKAMCMLGNMYYSGEWVKVNVHQALQWYSKSEKYNNPVALLMIGMFYMEGKVVSKNLLTAKAYFIRVTLSNDADAKRIAVEKLKLLRKLLKIENLQY